MAHWVAGCFPLYHRVMAAVLCLSLPEIILTPSCLLLFVLLLFVEIESPYVAYVIWNSGFPCLKLLSFGISGMYHYSQLIGLFVCTVDITVTG